MAKTTYTIKGPWGSGEVARCFCGGRPEAIPGGVIPRGSGIFAQCKRCLRELWAEEEN